MIVVYAFPSEHVNSQTKAVQKKKKKPVCHSLFQIKEKDLEFLNKIITTDKSWWFA